MIKMKKESKEIMADKFNAYLCPVCKKVHPALECKDYKAEIKNSEFIEFDIKTELLYQQGMSAKLNYLIGKSEVY